MKRIIIVIFILGMVLSGRAQSMYGEHAKADVKMKYVYSYEEALKQAKAEHKLIFFNCFADWAVPCHLMNKAVFSNQEFADWMDHHFVNFFIDVTTAEGRPLAVKYDIRYQPHYLILDTNGQIIHRIIGGAQLPEFQEKVARALSPETSWAGMTESYNNGERGTEFLRQYALVLRSTQDMDQYGKVMNEYFNRLNKEDWSKKENWIFFKDKLQKAGGEMGDYLLDHKREFVENNGLEQVNTKISSLYIMPVLGMAVGATPYDAGILRSVDSVFLKAEIPDNSSSRVIYKIAQYRGEKQLDKVLETLRSGLGVLDKRTITDLDLSLKDWKDPTESEKQRIVAYLNSRCEKIDLREQDNYRIVIKELINPEGIRFVKLSFEEALELARKERKFLFLDCFTSWCGPCKMMDRNVFSQRSVGDYFNENLVSLKVDMEKGEGPELQKKFEVQAYPTMLLIDSSGNIQYRIVGGMDPHSFMTKVRRGVDSRVGYTHLKQKYESGEHSVEWIPDYLLSMVDAGELAKPEEEVENYLSTLSDKEKTTPAVWKLYENYVSDLRSPEFVYLITHRKTFARNLGEKQVNLKIEKVIFPVIVGYLKHSDSQENLHLALELIKKADLPSDFSLSHLYRIMGWYEKKEFKKLINYYEKQVAIVQDQHTRLNLDVLLKTLLEDAPQTARVRALKYARKCLELSNESTRNSYVALVQVLTGD